MEQPNLIDTLVDSSVKDRVLKRVKGMSLVEVIAEAGITAKDGSKLTAEQLEGLCPVSGMMPALELGANAITEIGRQEKEMQESL